MGAGNDVESIVKRGATKSADRYCYKMLHNAIQNEKNTPKQEEKFE